MRFSLLLTLSLLAINSFAQTVTLPPSGFNNQSVNTQYIGSLATVTIAYSSPDVTDSRGNSRQDHIWGELIPYGLNEFGFGLNNPSPWRAGANENTVITFSHDVLVQGKALAAGTYGFHIIVKETGPWTLIFSNNSTAWGSYFYKEAEDVLRVEATKETNEYHEWLSYEFTDRQPDNCTLALMWENMKLPFKIEIPNIEEVYLANFRKELENIAGFNWQAWSSAADYCLRNEINLEEALSWVDNSISMPFGGEENFTNLSIKSQILSKLGRADESKATLSKAIDHPTASSALVHGLGRTFISFGYTEKAMAIFEANHKKYDGAWPTEVGMARGLSALGNYSEAIKHVEKAIEQAPNQLNKDHLIKVIATLKEGKDIN